MNEFEWRSTFDVPVAELFAWHERPRAFQRLVPPWEHITVVRHEGEGLTEGSRLVMRMRRGLVPVTWEALHTAYEKNHLFRDEQVHGPFAHWVHTHDFQSLGNDSSELIDHIDYRLPWGAVSEAVAGSSVRRSLARTFAFRHEQTRWDLRRHRAFADRGPWHILVSGASGLIGTALVDFLASGGHRVSRLVRRNPGAGEVAWDPEAGQLDRAALEGVDAVVHLAGESIADGRWTPERKERILQSRIKGTSLLANALASLTSPPRVFISASAIGYYGDTGDGERSETDGVGEGFLAQVCQAWEEAADPARQAGIRTVHPRTGVVLTSRGGALARMLPAFKACVGGRIGHGRQFMSWIHLDDIVGIIQRALFDETMAGPVNGVAPEAVTNAEFSRTLGRVLRRPVVLPMPAFAIKALFGEMGREVLLTGSRVSPRRLLDAGFAFRFPRLEEALRLELGRFEGSGSMVETA